MGWLGSVESQIEKLRSTSEHKLGRCLWLVPAAVCLAGFFIQFRFILLSGFQQVQVGLGDGRLVNFTLEHSYRWLRRMELHTDFWSPPIFYPYEGASAFTDTMLGFAPLYWLPRGLGAEPLVAMQFWFAQVYFLNFLSCYLLLRVGLQANVWSSSAASILLSMMALSWIGHPQLVPFFLPLLGLLALFRIFGANALSPTARLGWLVVLFACALLQLWGAVYLFFFFGLLLGLSALVSLCMRNARVRLMTRVRELGWPLVLVGVVTAALAAPVVLHYQATAAELGYRSYVPTQSPELASWISRGDRDWVLGRFHGAGNLLDDDHQALGPGTLLALMAGIGFWRRRREVWVRVSLASTALFVVLLTDFFGFSLWQWVHEVLPGAGGIRAHWRAPMVMIPLVAMGVAIAFDWAMERRRYLVALGVSMLCWYQLYFGLGTINRAFLDHHIQSLAQRVDPTCHAFFLVGLGKGRDWVAEDAAWVVLASGKPTVNGRYGNFPDGYELPIQKREVPPTPQVLADVRDSLLAWSIAHGVEPASMQLLQYEALSVDKVRPFRGPKGVAAWQELQSRTDLEPIYATSGVDFSIFSCGAEGAKTQ